jgi:hypothetical protein
MINSTYPPLLLLEAEKTVLAQFDWTTIGTNENVQATATITEFGFPDNTFLSDLKGDDVNRGMEFVNSFIPQGLELKLEVEKTVLAQFDGTTNGTGRECAKYSNDC